jgi:hypothetical protein
MAWTAQISKEKRQSITLRHEGQSIQNISRTVKASSSAVAKTIKCYDETGSTSAVQRRLCESGLHGWIVAKKPLLKDTNKKKRLAWSKKHEQWTLDWWKYVLWCGAKLEIFGSNRRMFVRRGVGERMISLCGVMVCGCFAGDIYLEFKAHLTCMATTAFCSDTPSHLDWG